MEHYYLGAGLLLAGVWTNASLLYFLRKLQDQLKNGLQWTKHLLQVSPVKGEGQQPKN
ncbi:MAG: hypothetical protein AAFV80_02415 [Bacteroidota bacterium]